MEAGSELHLGIMHVGTVLQQSNTDTGSKLCRQRLGLQSRTGNLLTSLSDEQTEGILGRANLTSEVVGLRLCGQIGSLSTLYAGRANTTECELLLHHLPRLLSHIAHLGNDSQLLVEHQQGVVGIGDAADNLCTDCHLVVFHAQQLHLGRTLLRQDVAEEIYSPAGSHRNRV